jgi:RNA polymerase subunit RPABC4/transcription elongation factor Spt4
MNGKRIIVISGIVIAVAIAVMLLLETIHLALGAVILLVDFVVVYSYTTVKERDIPKELHGEFEEAFAEEMKEEFLEKKTKICLVCQTENNINRKYCKKCNSLIQNITCPVCDTINPHTAKYCSHCDSILQNKSRS